MFARIGTRSLTIHVSRFTGRCAALPRGGFYDQPDAGAATSTPGLDECEGWIGLPSLGLSDSLLARPKPFGESGLC